MVEVDVGVELAGALPERGVQSVGRVEEGLVDAYRAGREDAKLRLRAYLRLATNAHAFYLACDEGRRLCNQAFFTKTPSPSTWT